MSRVPWCVALGCAVAGCESPTVPTGSAVVFERAVVELDSADEGTVRFTPFATSGVRIVADTAHILGSAISVPSVVVSVSPSVLDSLEPRREQSLCLAVSVGPGAPPGRYSVRLAVRSVTETFDGPEVRFAVTQPIQGGTPVRSLAVVGAPSGAVRQGDMVQLTADARNRCGAPLSRLVSWRVTSGAGFVDSTGAFVGYEGASLTVVVAADQVADTARISIRPRGLSGTLQVVGRGRVDARYTGGLWVRGTTAYTGTFGCRWGSDNVQRCGDVLYVWDVANSSVPVLVDSVLTEAGQINDVKVSPDGRLAAVTQELSRDGLNGITLLSLTDPLHPAVVTRYTQGLEGGVRNTWFQGSYLYVAARSIGVGLKILDISSPQAPALVASYFGGSSFLHDVVVRDGLAFLAHWDAGLIILDVGNGIAGGSPSAPVGVSRIGSLGGQTHSVWYWPSAHYVFVTEEDRTLGKLHVVDLSDPFRPREVATYRVPGDAPHNLWLDESRGILYVAWYTQGLRALDVSGVLLGDLGRGGREAAAIQTQPGYSDCFSYGTCTWGAQLANGLLFASDVNSGLWVFTPLR